MFCFLFCFLTCFLSGGYAGACFMIINQAMQLCFKHFMFDMRTHENLIPISPLKCSS